MNLLQIQHRITQLMARWVVELKGATSMSHTDPNIASEYIALQLLREIYGWSDLRNLNTESASFPGIDLADDNARVAIQITSKPTLDKIKHTLSEFADEDRKLYERYDRLIIYILVEKQRSYSDTTFDDIIGARFRFDKEQDILDYRDLLRAIQGFPIAQASRVLEILEEHFGSDTQPHPPPAAALVLPLPADLPDFVGRQAEIDLVRTYLDEQRIVAISGMGGSGKTALAIHVAHQLLAEGRFPDAQLYIDLKGAGTSSVDPVDALDSLISAILKPDPNRRRGLKALQALWQEAIRGRDALLILDNAVDAAQVHPLLPGCATCAVLITSRQRFTLPGARRLDLSPMELGEARTLLRELAFRLDDDGADEIAGLCGRLPQALRVAGNYLGLNDDVTPDRYAAMLADERTRLAQLRDPDDPDLDVDAAIALSVAQLDPVLRRVWALLSLFPAPFDLPAVVALWDQPEDQARTQLQALRNRSLITYDPGTTRYHQHDLVRLAAVRDLEDLTAQEANAAHLRLARHYEQVARNAKLLFKQGDDNVLKGLTLFDLEWPHIQAGQAWTVAHAGDDDEATHLCMLYPDAAAYLLSLRVRPRDQLAWLQPALRAARHLRYRSAEGVHLGSLGTVYKNLGEMDKAIEHYQQALEIARQIGDRRGEGNRLNNLGTVYKDFGETDKALEHYQQALEIARKIGDRRGEGNRLGNLGTVYKNLGETDKALDHYQQAGEIARKIGDRRGEANSYWNLGLLYEENDPARAVELMELCVTIRQEIGHPDAKANAQRVEEIRIRL